MAASPTLDSAQASGESPLAARVSPPRDTGAVRAARFLVALVALGLIWCVVLPWAAERPRMANRLEWLDEKGIDPSAMYYTELEMMRPILKKLAR